MSSLLSNEYWPAGSQFWRLWGMTVALAVAGAFLTGGLVSTWIDSSTVHPVLILAGALPTCILAVLALRTGKRAANSERQLHEQNELLAVTLASIGDGVIVTDSAGRVSFLNSEAERLTGWPLRDAAGKPLASIFNIINESTRQPVESPVQKVLVNGRVAGLANHTVLIARDGRETPIDDSGAPIRDERGRLRGVVLVFRNVCEQRQAEAVLRGSHERIQLKLNSILSPEGNIGDLELADIIDVPAIQSMLEDCHRFMGIPMAFAVLDLKGEVLVGVSWQEICTQFHRVHPESCQHCLESDTQLSVGVAPGEFRLYHCKNSMWDIATPIMVGDQHVGNIFAGQFFFDDEHVDEEVFRTQARRYGFDESAYLSALQRVPRLSRQRLNAGMSFFTKFAGLLSQLSYSNIKLARTLAERQAMTDTLQQSEAALRESEEQLRRRAEEVETLMDVAPVAIWLSHDPYCHRITGNRMANAFYEADAGENVSAAPTPGEPVPARRFFHEGRELSPEELPMQRAAREGIEVKNVELDVLLPSGTRLFMVGSASPLRDADGKIRGCLGTFLDLTEHKRLERERLDLLEAERAARSEVERNNRMKDEFLATVSHELRSPLGAIVGWTGLLAKGKIDVAKATGVIRQSADNLSQLVDDLLDMSRIISGKIHLKPEPVNLPQIINNVIESVQFSAQAKSIHINVSFDPDLRPLTCDSNRVQQIIWNLLTNAIKFTPNDGWVLVGVSQSADSVSIRVQDSGKGIAAEFLPYIFDRFRQQDSSTARQHGGLGLGLAIVKHLAELHGGQVSADSEGLNQGATFTVVLPRTCEARQTAKDRALPVQAPLSLSSLDESALREVRILTVDDDPYWRELTERTLADFGAVVGTAASAQEAFELLDSFRPDLLISDLGMPGEDGYTFLRRIRATGDWRAQLPSIALTALNRPDDRERALAVGYDEHLSKPFEPGTLCLLAARLATQHRTK